MHRSQSVGLRPVPDATPDVAALQIRLARLIELYVRRRLHDSLLNRPLRLLPSIVGQFAVAERHLRQPPPEITVLGKRR